MEVAKPYRLLKLVALFAGAVFCTYWAWRLAATQFRIETTMAVTGPMSVILVSFLIGHHLATNARRLPIMTTLLFLGVGTVVGYIFKNALHAAYPHAIVVPFSFKTINVSY